MYENVIQQKAPGRPFFVVMQEFMLCLYILLTPIYKAFGEFAIAGYSPLLWVIALLLFAYIGNLYRVLQRAQWGFCSIAILIVFVLDLLLVTKSSRIGWVLPVFLYAAFLQTDSEVSKEKLHKAFYFSAILAAIFSVSLGFVGGTVTRVAATIDGSIAPVTITLVLFGHKKEEAASVTAFNPLKVAAMIASLIVLVFGMSRARFLITAVCFAVYAITKINDMIKSGGKVSPEAVVFFLAAIIFMLLFFLSGVFAPLLNRFLNEGLESLGRAEETRRAWLLFQQNKIFGGGWGDYNLRDQYGSVVSYDNHNSYVAILARGGLLVAIPMFLSFWLLLRRAWKIRKKTQVALVIMLVFLLLSYGNAGLFNYTIGSMIPLAILDIRKEMYHNEQENSVPAES